MHIGQIARSIRAGNFPEAREAILKLRVSAATCTSAEGEQIRKSLLPFTADWLTEIRQDLESDTSFPYVLRDARETLKRSVQGAIDALRQARSSYSFRSITEKLKVLDAAVWAGSHRRALATLAGTILPNLTASPKPASKKKTDAAEVLSEAEA